MIVHCIELGSHWWTRIATDADGHFVPRGSVFFNSTAIPRGVSGKHWHRCWTIPGIVRFNVAGFPRAIVPTDLHYINAFTEGIETLRGTNRLLFRCAATARSPVDAYLVVVRSIMCGRIAFGSGWKTDGIRIVCASASKGEQETLILMPPDGVIQTDEGIWRIAWQDGQTSRRRARLVPASPATSGTGRQQHFGVRPWSNCQS
jgi:hypothetical protein